MTTIHINSFVTRQTPESPFSHFEHTWEELVARVEHNFDNAKPGYREGVILVPVEPEGFFSGVVTLKEGDKLVGEYKPRRPGEEPRKQVRAVGATKMPAKQVDIVLYASSVLAEDGDNEQPADGDTWEVISINANPVEGEMPIPTGALIANHLGLDGGTATNMTDSEFVALLRESVAFWKDKALCG